MKNPIVLVGGLIVLVIIGAAGWYLASPLFINNEVEEEFPFDIPSAEALAQMPEDELKEMEAEVLEAAAQMPDKVMEETMPDSADAPTIVVQGQFQDADSFHQGSGQATVYTLPDGGQLLRFEDFTVTNGPDLHVILSKHPSPVNSSDIGEDYIDLGSLKGNVGSQNYEIPAGIDISEYGSVVIYCKPFHVVFSTATLG